MVLDHVRQRARFLIVRAAPFHPDRFRPRDLHVVHVAPVPQRFEDPVAEPERQDILHGLFAQVVVDAVDVRFAEDLVQMAAQFPRAGQVVPERFLHHQPAPPAALAQARRAQPQGRLRVLAGLCRKVKQRVPACVPLTFDRRQFLPEPLVQARIADVSRHVIQPAREGRPHLRIDGGVFGELLDRFQHLAAELVVAQRGARDADHREPRRKSAVVRQPVEGGHELAPGEVPIGAENHDRAFRCLPFKPQWVLKRIFDGH